jgi:hypothetical protein
MSWDDDERAFLENLADRPAARSPATMGEIWRAEFDNASLSTATGVGQPVDRAYNELVGGLAAASGQDLRDFARSRGVDLTRARNFDERIAMIGGLVDALPEDKRTKELEALKDVRRRAAESAAKTEREAADVASATYGLSGHAMAFLAGTARQAVDPLNLAAMAVTAPIGGELFGGPLLATMARQAAAGGAAQALVEPHIQAARAELGLEAGLGQAAGDIAGAAFGAAGMAGLLKAGAWAIRKGAGAFRSAPMRAPDIPSQRVPEAPVASADHWESLPGLVGDDFDAGARFAEADQVTGADALQELYNRGRLTHVARVVREGGEFTPAPIDVDAIARLGEAEGLRARDRDLVSQLTGLPAGDPASALTLARLGELERQIANPETPRAELRRLRDRRDQLLAETTPEQLQAAAAPLEQRRTLEAERASIAARLGEIDKVTPADVDPVQHAANLDFAARVMETAPRAEPLPVLEVPLETSGPRPPAPEPEAPAPPAEKPAAPPAKRMYGPRARSDRTWSLFEYLRSLGGLKPQADLEAILDVNPNVPFFGKLMQPNGMTLDRAWEEAINAGYLHDPGRLEQGRALTTDYRDLLRLIEEEARGNKQYRMGEERTKGPNREQDLAQEEEHKAAIVRAFDDRMRELHISKIEQEMRDRALQIMEREEELDPLAAYEKALVEKEERIEHARQIRDDEQIELPGWDVPDDAGATPADGGTAAAGRQPGEPASGAGSREPGAGDGAPGLDDLRAAYDKLKAEQGGVSAVKISDLIRETGLSKDEVHRLLLEEARQGNVSLHPTQSVNLPKAVSDAAINVPGEPYPFVTAIIKDAAQENRPVMTSSVADRELAADADRALADAGGDIQLHIVDEQGNVVKTSAAEAIRTADEDAAAAAEFNDCIERNGE